MKLLNWNERRKMKRELRAWSHDLDWVYDKSYYTDQDYIRCVQDIFEHPVFQSMEKYIQHGNTSCRAHCIQVSYFSYNLAKKLNLDYVACARAGLLHDLFLYDWHDHFKRTGCPFHGLTHPVTALRNANRYFRLTRVEKDIILKHMWPLTPVLPRYKESLIVSYADKYCSVAEVGIRLGMKIRRKLAI